MGKIEGMIIYLSPDREKKKKDDGGATDNMNTHSISTGGLLQGLEDFQRPRMQTNPVGRRPTTGDYIGLKKAMEEYQEQLSRAIKLEKEARISKLTGKETMQLSKINTADIAEEAEYDTTANIVSRIRGLQIETLKVSKGSSNFKGTHQRTLNEAAGFTIGLLEALRTRMDRTPEERAEAEILSMKKEQEKLKKDTERKIREMQETLNRAIEQTEVEKRKAEHHLNLLKEVTLQKEELWKQLREMREEQNKWWGTNQPMEIEIEPSIPDIGTKQSTLKKEEIRWAKTTTDEERKAYPIVRPPIEGKATILEDRTVNILEERNEKGEGLALPLRTMVQGIQETNKKKKDRETMEKKEGNERRGKDKKDKQLKEKEMNQLEPRAAIISRPTRPLTESELIQKITHLILKELRGGTDPKTDIKKKTINQASSNGLTSVPTKKGKEMSEARKARKKEKRREKRREKARRRAEGLSPLPSRRYNMEKEAVPTTRTAGKIAPLKKLGPPPSNPGASEKAPSREEVPWTEVIGRKTRRRENQSNLEKRPDLYGKRNVNRGTKGYGNDASLQKPLFKKPPRTAAVQIACFSGDGAEAI